MTATTCPHGFAPGECLICRALSGGTGGSTDPAQGPAPEGRRRRRGRTATPSRLPEPFLGRPSDPPPARPDAVYPPGSSPRDRDGRHPSAHIAAVVAGLAIVVLIAWAAAGAVFALLHMIELLLVAGAAGWAGYRLGYVRGRRARR